MTIDNWWNWFGPSLVSITPILIFFSIVTVLVKQPKYQKIWKTLTYLVAVIYIIVMASLVIAPVIFLI